MKIPANANREGRLMQPKRKILSLTLGLSILLWLPLASLAATPDTVVMKSKLGDITFPHLRHERLVSNCETCHHMGVAAGSCITCHNQNPEAPKAKDAFHRLCKGCHADKKGPSGCKDCHKK